MTAHMVEGLLISTGVMLSAIWWRRVGKRGREVLLRGLAALPKAERDAFITSKFKPQVQEELRAQLSPQRRSENNKKKQKK